MVVTYITNKIFSNFSYGKMVEWRKELVTLLHQAADLV